MEDMGYFRIIIIIIIINCKVHPRTGHEGPRRE